MDPNLYFRFSIPGWTALFVGMLMMCLSGKSGVKDVITFLDAHDFASAAIAAFGSIGLGFLLNTFVEGVCELLKKGPVYTKTFEAFYQYIVDAVNDKEDDNKSRDLSTWYDNLHSLLKHRSNIRKRMDRLQRCVLVAHFEYRTDPECLIGWRRRQRAAFFGNWANALALVVALCFTGGYWIPVLLKHELSSLWVLGALVVVCVLACLFILIASRSAERAEQEQLIWITSWRSLHSTKDIVEFLKNSAVGDSLKDRRAETKGRTEPDPDTSAKKHAK